MVSHYLHVQTAQLTVGHCPMDLLSETSSQQNPVKRAVYKCKTVTCDHAVDHFISLLVLTVILKRTRLKLTDIV